MGEIRLAKGKIFIGNRSAGWMENDIYYTRRSNRRHFFRKLKGYAISVSILKVLKQYGIKWILIMEYDRNDERNFSYRCLLSDYDLIQPFRIKGWDEQKCIPLKMMKKVKKNEKT